jgi:hypothetical protein
MGGSGRANVSSTFDQSPQEARGRTSQQILWLPRGAVKDRCCASQPFTYTCLLAP